MKNEWRVLAAVCVLVVGVYAYAAYSGFMATPDQQAATAYYNRLVEGFQAGQLNLKVDAPAGLTQLADPMIQPPMLRMALVEEQLKGLERVQAQQLAQPVSVADRQAAQLMQLRGVGPVSALVLAKEFFGPRSSSVHWVGRCPTVSPRAGNWMRHWRCGRQTVMLAGLEPTGNSVPKTPAFA
jgi:hypothetical protein